VDNGVVRLVSALTHNFVIRYERKFAFAAPRRHRQLTVHSEFVPEPRLIANRESSSGTQRSKNEFGTELTFGRLNPSLLGG
jgi:hypothetical protein